VKESASNKTITLRELLREAFRTLFPSFGYLISSQAGFLCSFIVFITWILTHNREHYHHYFNIEEDEKALIVILDEIKKQEARLNLLEKARNKLSSEGKSLSTIDEVIKAEKNILENLYTEYKLRQLRIEAIRRLRAVGDPNILQMLNKIIKRIEKGEEFHEQQYEILKRLEDMWRRKEIEISMLSEILNSI